MRLRIYLILILLVGDTASATDECCPQPSTISPKDAAFHKALSELDVDRSIELWNEFLNQYGQTAPALVFRARRFNDYGQSAHARRDLLAARTKNCKLCRANLRFELARAELEQGNLNSARTELNLATFTINRGGDVRWYDVQEWHIRELQGWHSYESDRFQEAIDSIVEAIDSSGSSLIPKLSRSSMLICLGRGDVAGREALACLGIAKHPSSELETLVMLGYFGFLQQGDKKRAASVLKKALAFFDVSTNIYPRLGYLAGDVSAVELFDSAKNSHSKMTDAQCCIAMKQHLTDPTVNVATHIDWVVKTGKRGRATYRITLAMARGWPNAQRGVLLRIK